MPVSRYSAPTGRPPVARGGWCSCTCHDIVEADEAERDHEAGLLAVRVAINGLGAVAVACTLVTEAAVACDTCRRHHSPALSGRPAELAPTRHWSPRPLRGVDDGAA
ncbi:MAG: hypothetical protein ACYC1Z_14905 [Georgenia sp.]